MLVICEDMLDPLNVGSVFRLADAMGVEKVYLTGISAAPPHRKISKTARATEKAVPFAVFENKLQLIDHLRSSDYTLIGLEITNQSGSILDADFSRHERIALWVGGEKPGISDEVLSRLDYCLHIPMRGMNSSMNVVQALGIGLFEITRQWLAAKA